MGEVSSTGWSLVSLSELPKTSRKQNLHFKSEQVSLRRFASGEVYLCTGAFLLKTCVGFLFSLCPLKCFMNGKQRVLGPWGPVGWAACAGS